MMDIKEKICKERDLLTDIISKYGINSAIALEKSKDLDKLILQITKTELKNKVLNVIK